MSLANLSPLFILLFLSSAILSSSTRTSKLLYVANKTALGKTDTALISNAAGLLKRIQKGCSPNICFVLDASNRIGSKNYHIQKEFVLLVSAIVGADSGASFSAVQYGGENTEISRIDKNVWRFLNRVDETTFGGGSKGVVGNGMAFCRSQLRRKRGLANKIVVFGDETGCIGQGEQQEAVDIADSFRADGAGNEVCAVMIGDRSEKSRFWVDVVGGMEEMVAGVEGWAMVLAALRRGLRNVCEVTPRF